MPELLDIDTGAPEFDPANFIAQERQRTTGIALNSIDEDTAKVGRAYQLARATGAQPALVHNDLENFETQAKSALTGDLLNNNDWLRQFIDQDQMRAKLSADDWGNLDKVTSAVKDLRKFTGFWTKPEGPFDKLYTGFKEGFGDGPVGEWVMGVPFMKDKRMAQAMAAAGWSPAEIIFRGLSGGIRGGTEFVSSLVKETTGDEQLARDVAGMAELQLTGQGVHTGGALLLDPIKTGEAIRKSRLWIDERTEPPARLDPNIDKIKERENDLDIKRLEEATSAAEASATRQRDPQSIADLVRLRDQGNIEVDGDAIARLYGDKPPSADDGLLGWVPRFAEQLEIARQTGSDISIPLADWLAYADANLMKLLRDDIRVRPGGVTKNEAKALNGAEPAEINSLRDQATADLVEKATAGAEEGAQLTPTDQARAQLGQGALKPVETDPVIAEYLKNKRKEEPVDDPLAQMRHAGGLEPLFSVGDRKLKIERSKSRSRYAEEQIAKGNIPADEFGLYNEAGQKVGFMEAVPYNNGERVYIDNIGGMESKGFGPASEGLISFGPALIRELIKQIKELYPNVKEVGGFRISGARGKAGTEKEVWVNVEKFMEAPNGWSHIDAGTDYFAGLFDGMWKEKSQQVRAYEKPEMLWTQHEQEIRRGVYEVLGRILGKDAHVEVAQGLKMGEEHAIHGVYQGLAHDVPRIIVSLMSSDPRGTARHEGIHYLRNGSFFTPAEWFTLERAAREEGWAQKHGIEERYADKSPGLKLEEAIAEEYRAWAKGDEIVNKRYEGVFQKIKDFLAQIMDMIKRVTGKSFTAEDIFAAVERGEIGARKGDQTPEAMRRQAEERNQAPELEPLAQEPKSMKEQLTNIGDRPLYATPGTIGMNETQRRLFEKRLAEQHEGDVAWATKQAEKAHKRTLTAEYRQEKKNTQSEVEADFDARPDVAADIYFARGELFGEKVEKLKIDREDVKAMGLDTKGLPKDYFAKEGGKSVDLDDFASLVGYPTGRSLIEDLIRYNEPKLTANMSAKAFRNRMIDIEVERRMKANFGSLEENILDRVKEQVTSMAEQNRLAEETLALGVRAGLEATIKKAELREAISDRFEASPMRGETFDKYLRASGKKATETEISMLKEDWAAAYRASTGKYVANVLMREAAQLEREQKQFSKLAKRLAKREVKGLDIDYQDQVQTLLWQAGVPTRRSPIEIQRSQAGRGKGTLQEFYNEAINDGYALNISQDILDGRVKPLDQMTVGEFRDFHNAVRSLNAIGREVDKINIAGEKRDFAAYKKEVIDNITSKPYRPESEQRKDLTRFIWQADAELTRIETWLKELDLGEEMGPLVNTIIRPMAYAKHEEYGMQEKLAKDIKALPTSKEWRRSLSDKIENDFILDPVTKEPFEINRSDLINMMLNRGNKGNWKKFVESWGSSRPNKRASEAEADAFRNRMEQFFDQNARKEDWDFVQGVWDIYKGFEAGMDKVWMATSGTQPKLVEAMPIQNQHGNYAGGYYPLVRSRFYSGTPADVSNKAVFGPNYPNYNTPQGHLQTRTASSYYVDFKGDHGLIPIRMQQVIHDIAYREGVMAAQKIIKDKEIMAAIRQHYGAEYEKQLRPWLERVAHGATLDETNLELRDRVLRSTRMNLINYALPFNYVVTFTPDLGAPTFRSLANYMQDRPANVALAEKHSKEIPHAIYNMDRDFREAMQRAVGEGTLDTTKMKVAQWGYQIVSSISKEFRRATFLDKFTKAIAEGKDEATAAAIADSYVRERHGSAALADLPPIMAGGEAGRLLTMFYGYWNTQYNWLRTIKGDLSRGDYMNAVATAYGTIIIGSLFGAFIANQAKEEDSYAKRFAKAIPLQLLGMMPYGIREAGTYAVEGMLPKTPLASLIQSVGSTSRDFYKAFKKEPIDKGIRHTTATAGMLLGIPGMLQIGRTGQGLYDVAKGQQKPRNIFEWGRLLATGEARLKRQGER